MIKLKKKRILILLLLILVAIISIVSYLKEKKEEKIEESVVTVTEIGQKLKGRDSGLVYKAIVKNKESILSENPEKNIYLIKILGKKKNRDEYKIYANVHSVEYKKTSDGKYMEDSGYSIPMKIVYRLSGGKYVDPKLYIPEDGEEYPISLKKITKDYPFMYEKMLNNGGNFGSDNEINELAKEVYGNNIVEIIEK